MRSCDSLEKKMLSADEGMHLYNRLLLTPSGTGLLLLNGKRVDNEAPRTRHDCIQTNVQLVSKKKNNQRLSSRCSRWQTNSLALIAKSTA